MSQSRLTSQTRSLAHGIIETMESRLLLATDIPVEDFIVNVSQSTGVFADSLPKGTHEGAALEDSFGDLLGGFYSYDTSRGYYMLSQDRHRRHRQDGRQVPRGPRHHRP